MTLGPMGGMQFYGATRRRRQSVEMQPMAGSGNPRPADTGGTTTTERSPERTEGEAKSMNPKR